MCINFIETAGKQYKQTLPLVNAKCLNDSFCYQDFVPNMLTKHHWLVLWSSCRCECLNGDCSDFWCCCLISHTRSDNALYYWYYYFNIYAEHHVLFCQFAVSFSCQCFATLLLKLVFDLLQFKGGVERISTFQNKAHQGIQLCLGDSGKYKEKIFMLV